MFMRRPALRISFPTLLQAAGQNLPEWVEGEVLPPYAEKSPNSERDIFSIKVVGSIKDQPIEKGTIALIRGDYKLIYYFGYQELDQTGDLVELYHLINDPDELNNLVPTQPELAKDLLSAVQSKLAEVNQPYR